MRFYDIFNGDADGLCALHQLRLADPRESTLVTGVKRNIGLLAGVDAESGDELTVLDISLDANREALLIALGRGAQVRYFDHHFAGDIPQHPLLEAHIDTAAEICTSLIVDRHLRGRHRAWAVVAAFGDNLRARARAVATELGLGGTDVETLRELGECLNYNAYGASIADLHFHPALLYRRMQPYADPLAFCSESPELELLRNASADDLQQALALPVEKIGADAVAVFMPESASSRRIAGTFANELARRHPDQTVALLVRTGAGHQVSLRAPERGGRAMHLLAQQFKSGNGRERSAGIQFLPDAEVTRLMTLLGRPASA